MSNRISDGIYTKLTDNLNTTISNISHHLAPSGHISRTIHARNKCTEQQWQEEHTSNLTPVSQTLPSFTTVTTTTPVANLWCLATEPIPQVVIVTTTSQIVARQPIGILIPQQQSFPHTSDTRTWILYTIQPPA
ncbi:unnamed protein product [Lactuca saligna]|uniref:Uncharacterized protein n=1 Tax=Lactuca saligna TaxID=75948 RepID=A0AA35YRC4_LACSI|nr:unnamed protein product [Lactuca saligna]